MLKHILVNEKPIKNFPLICSVGAIISLSSGFIHDYIPIIVGIFGYLLIVLRKYRYDKRCGIDPFALSTLFKKRNSTKEHVNYNTQENQLATLALILMFLSWFSYGLAPFL